jgi:hypothetical protein
MPTPLKPGSMGSPTHTGTPSEFANSMAAAIEGELNSLLQAEGLPMLALDNSTETRDRRRLFVAIARGVLRHLDERRTAITVEDSDGVTSSPEFDIDRPGGSWS